MAIKLDDYQIDAIYRLKTGSVLCGGVGSGKSRTALAYFYLRVCGGLLPINGEGDFAPMRTPRNLVIITTAKKRDTFEWMDECAAFALFPNPEDNDSGISVTIDSWNNIGKYCNVCGAFVIFDEQRLVGSGAWVKAFYQIAKKNQWILLSATPGDTWMDYIPLFVANGFYKNRSEFLRRHVVFNRFCRYPKVDRYLETDRLVYLKNRILIHMKYIKSTEVHSENLICDYDEQLYSETARNRWNPFLDEPIRDAAGYCATLRRIANSSQGRIEKTKEVICKHPKLIIFYNFDYELEILREIGKELKVQTAEWNGHKHMPIPKTESWIYLVQYSAGAEGWNCIETDTILFYSQSYSYKMTHQAAGRIDRRNTPFRDLYCIHLVSNSSIDFAIKKCYNQKRDFNEKDFVKF